MGRSLLVTALFLAGCAPDQQRVREAQSQVDEFTCQEFGFQVQTEAFSDCVLQQEQMRQQRAASAIAHLSGESVDPAVGPYSMFNAYSADETVR